MRVLGCAIVGGSRVTALMYVKQACLPVLRLDQPQPVGFVLVGVIADRRRHRLCAFAAEVVETAPQLATGQRVLIVCPVGDCRREVLKQRPKPDGGCDVTARARLRRARIMRIALPTISRAPPIDFV